MTLMVRRMSTYLDFAVRMAQNLLRQTDDNKHGHICACGNLWEHEDRFEAPSNPEEWAQQTLDHTCSSCGREQYTKAKPALFAQMRAFREANASVFADV